MPKLNQFRSTTVWRQLLFGAKHKVKESFYKILNLIRGFRDDFSFPFDVSLPLPTHAKTIFSSVIHFLDTERIEYFVADGTLLGIYRDYQLIEHDTDLDFYLKDDLSVQKITHFFESQGFHVGRVMKRWSRIFQISFYDDKKLIVDFCIWYPGSDGNRFWVAPEIHERRIQSESYFESAIRINWEGISFRTFPNVEDWLTLVYGENWSVPETVKSDWRKSVQDFEA